MSRLILLSASQAFEQRVRGLVDAAAGGGLRRLSPEQAVTSPARFADTLGDDVEVVALGPSMAVEDALPVARALDTARPGVTVLLVAAPTEELWQQAMDAGIRAVVRPGAEDKELVETFERALETATRRRDALHAHDDAAATGRVITVLGPKGGAGKTMLAANLAVGLAGVAPDSVAIVDLDLQFGDLGSALQLMPEHTFAEATGHRGALDPTSLKMLLTAHPAKFYALCAPASPADGENVPVTRVSEAIALLTDEFPWVVVDTGAGVTEHALAAVERSTDLVLVCTMDVASVRALRKLLDALDELGITRPTRHVVLNRADSRVGLSVEDIEATLGVSVDLGIPSSRLIPESMNQGATLLEQDSRARITRQLHELVGRFTPQQQPAPAHRRRGGLFSGRTKQ